MFHPGMYIRYIGTSFRAVKLKQLELDFKERHLNNNKKIVSTFVSEYQGFSSWQHSQSSFVRVYIYGWDLVWYDFYIVVLMHKL